MKQTRKKLNKAFVEWLDKNYQSSDKKEDLVKVLKKAFTAGWDCKKEQSKIRELECR